MSKEGDEYWAKAKAGTSKSASPATTDPGFLSKVATGAGQDLKSLLYIPAGVAHLVKPLLPGSTEKPSEVYPETIRQMGEYYKGYKHPVKMFEEHPINTILDAATAISGAGALLKGGAGVAGRAGMISAERAGQLGRIGELARTPLASAVKVPANRIMKVGEAAIDAGKTWDEMTFPEKVGARVKGLQHQTDFTAHRNAKMGQNYQKAERFVAQAKKEAPELFDLTNDEGAFAKQYAELSRSELELTPQGKLILDAIENPKSPIYNDRLARAVKFGKANSLDNLKAMMAESGNTFTEADAKMRIVAPTAKARLLREIPEFEKLPMEQQDAMLAERAKQILKTEKTDNMFYLSQVDPESAKWALQLPTSDFLKTSYKKGFQKKFRGSGEKAPFNFGQAVMGRTFERFGREGMVEMANEIVQKYGKKIMPGEKYNHSMEAPFNPTIDVWRTRAAQNAYRYMARNADRFSEAHGGLITKTVDELFENLKTVLDEPDLMTTSPIRERSPGALTEQAVGRTVPITDAESALIPKQSFLKGADDLPPFIQPASESMMRKISLGMEELNRMDPGLSKAIFEGLDPTLKGFLSESLKRTGMGQVQALAKFMERNPSYRIPRVVKQALDKSSTFDEYAKLMKPLVDRPMDLWRFGVLGSSPRWLLYNAMGNVAQNVMHGTSPMSFVEAWKVKDRKYKGVELPPSIGQTMAKVDAGLPESRYGFVKLKPNVKTYAPLTGTVKRIEQAPDRAAVPLYRGNVYAMDELGQGKNIQGYGIEQALPSMFGDARTVEAIKGFGTAIQQMEKQLEELRRAYKTGNWKQIDEVKGRVGSTDFLEGQIAANKEALNKLKERLGRKTKIEKEAKDLGLVWMSPEIETAEAYANSMNKMPSEIRGERPVPTPNIDRMFARPQKTLDLKQFSSDGRLFDKEGNLVAGANIEGIEKALGIKLESLPDNRELGVPTSIYQLFRGENAKFVVDRLKAQGYDSVVMKEGAATNFLVMDKEILSHTNLVSKEVEVATNGLREFQTSAPSHWQRVMSKVGGATKATLGVIVNANGRMEQLFRDALYLDEAKKMAYRQRIGKVGIMGAYLNQAATKETMLNIMRDPAMAGEVLKTVDDFMFNYGNLSPLERNVFRRVVPFYSWYKNMFKLTGYTLPAKYPIRTNVMWKFAQMGKQAWNEDMASMGIDIKHLPKWMEGIIPIKYDPKAKQLTYWNTQGPNIFQTVATPNMLAALNPMIKIALERLLHRDVFRDRKFTDPNIKMDYRGKLVDRSGQETAGVNPPLLEHIGRQVPPYQAAKEALRYRQFGYVPLEYDTNSLFNPLPITVKGEPQLKRGYWFTSGPKLLGVSMGQYTIPEQEKAGSRWSKMATKGIIKQQKEMELAKAKMKARKP